MPRSRSLARRASLVAVVTALCGGLTQGASILAGYATGESRLAAVSALVGVASALALLPSVYASKKNDTYIASVRYLMVHRRGHQGP
jgi:hypothetical protein